MLTMVVLGLLCALSSASPLAPRAFTPLQLGQLAPQGWLVEQLITQANSLAGFMATSTFPGADHVNQSIWIGGDGSKQGGTTQWLPYWTNGQVPLVGLLQAVGAPATSRLDKELDLVRVVDEMMAYVLSHTNKTNGWIGPYTNEPGDSNGHGLWDPLNMLRSLMNYEQAHPEVRQQVAAASVAHLTQEAKLLETDPVFKWAQTRWPTFVEIAQYVIDEYVPKFGADPSVMPLGGTSTTAMLVNASALFKQKGMNWTSYYHQTGGIKFPEGSVNGWNTNDHGVNNAEGALRYPAVSYRMADGQGDAPAFYRAEMDFVLGMMDKYQGQPNALFCADEVFCGRGPERGTETCAVVEAMASLEHAFTVFGDPALMDRVERLAFNAMPASLTADMWTHVYVQQANSVFAGRTGPRTPTGAVDPARRHHGLHYQHQAGAGGHDHAHAHAHAHSHHHRHQDADQEREARAQSPPCSRCGGKPDLRGDTPSGEDQTANFFGVSHFPCCITNFPQGWPKFAMHAFVLDTAAANAAPAVVVASLVPARAVLPEDSFGADASVTTESAYPFGDVANVTLTAGAGHPATLRIRIPGWATAATVNGKPAANGTFFDVACAAGGATTATVALNPEVRVELGWGSMGVKAGEPVNYTSGAAGAPLPTANYGVDLSVSGGASFVGSRESGREDVRSGGPGQNSTVTVMHPLAGAGHYIERVSLSFRYAAGYTPPAGQVKKGSQVQLLLLDPETSQTLASGAMSEPLDQYSFDNFKGYSPPVTIDAPGLHVPNSKPVLVALKLINNERNVQIQLDPAGGFNASVFWSTDVGPDPPVPPTPFLSPPTNGAAVVRGPLLFALHPNEDVKVTQSYNTSLPARPQAVDYEIGTSDTWNYALDLSSAAKSELQFVDTPSAGWSATLPFSTTDYPFYIRAKARQLPTWGFWEGSQITDPPPGSPVDGSAAAPDTVELKLVPFGGTNIRISVFPWLQ